MACLAGWPWHRGAGGNENEEANEPDGGEATEGLDLRDLVLRVSRKAVIYGIGVAEPHAVAK
jgi:hypothetical protein